MLSIPIAQNRACGSRATHRLLSAFLLSVDLSSGCGRSFVPHGPVVLAVNEPQKTPIVYVQWLGVSSWIISYGDDVVVVDPFFSRPSFFSVALSLLLPTLFDNFGYDAERINDVLPDLPEKTAFVLLGHAHYDHLMDVPYYMKRKSGQNLTYVGSRTARNILLGFKPDKLDFRIAEELPKIEKGRVRITAFPSDHAPHFFGYEFMSGKIKEPLTTSPTHSGDYVEGQTFIYFIDFMDDNQKILWRIFVNGAASSPLGAEALKTDAKFLSDHPVDIAILCVPGWDKVERYPDSILELIQPGKVILSHYDDFGSAYKNGEDPTVPGKMKFVPFANYGGFVTRLKELTTQQNYHYEIYQP